MKGSLVLLSYLAAFVAAVQCFTPSLIPLVCPRLALPIRGHGFHASFPAVHMCRATLPRMADGGGAAAVPPELKDVYVLIKESKRDLDNVQPDALTTRVCSDVLRNANGGGQDFEEMMQKLSSMPVAVEAAVRHPESMNQDTNANTVRVGKEKDYDWRTFEMPGNISVQVRERNFEEAGHGGALWGSAIGLSILLSLDRSSILQGKSVLELGSGVGLSGMTCAKGGAKTTTLSDWGQGVDEGEIPLLNPKAARLAASVDDETEKEESEDDVEGNWEFNDNPWSNMWEDTPEERDTEPQEVLRNLRETVVLNDCRSSCSVAHLDWHSSLAPGFLPDRTFDVVVGSDLIYYQSDAEALATTIATHTAAHGAAYIMCHRGRSGLKDMIRILGEKGKVKKEKYVIVKSSSTGEDGKVAWDIGEKVMLFTFRHHMD